MMGNVNRKATSDEMAHLTQTVGTAYPDCEIVFGGPPGHRAPRVRTLSFRIRDRQGESKSNYIWVMPDQIMHLTPGNIRWLVKRANGK